LLKTIKKARKGDDEAFSILFKKYEKDIYRMAFIYVSNQSDALDIVQETAYNAFKNIKSLKKPKFFKTWLMKIAIRCSLDLTRNRNKTFHLTPPLEGNLPDHINEDIDLKMTLRHLIDDLNEDEKSVILLRFYQDFTFKDISKVLDMPLGTCKTILYRAVNKLRNNLKGDDLL